MRRPVAVAWALALALACEGDVAPEPGSLAELEQNRRTWEDVRPSAYAYAVERLCFCGIEARGPVRVAVENGIVTGRRYVDTGEEVGASFADLFPSVDGLFAVLREALEAGAAEVRVTYDPHLGVPVDFWIDYRLQVADEEVGMRVTEAVEPASP